MKIFNCDMCGALVYFENTQCLRCGSQLGYVPVLDSMSSLEPVSGNMWKTLSKKAGQVIYKKCINYHWENVCNWMIPQSDPIDFCLSCRLNAVIPNLSVFENRGYWGRLETAKRRLVYSLLSLGLPIKNKAEDPKNGLAFSFLADIIAPEAPETNKVMIGHERGNITINVSEADDAVREHMRQTMKERYRTLLGHFRHEIAHYYWYMLIEPNKDFLEQFRQQFGDERPSYDAALKNYYANGAPADWQQRFVSEYASAHPWEDWAESWAHFLHMYDSLETARAWGLMVKLKKNNKVIAVDLENHLQTFEEMRDLWVALSCALNSLNRSMGMADVYPFIWSQSVIEKLRFVQKVIINSKQEVKS